MNKNKENISTRMIGKRNAMVYIRIHEIAKKRSNKTYKKARETTSKKVGVRKKKTCDVTLAKLECLFMWRYYHMMVNFLEP